MRPDGLALSLIAHLRSAPSGSRRALLESLQRWLKVHVRELPRDVRERWRLDDLAGVDLSAYPIEDASLDPDEELKQISRVPPRSMELLAMRIRDILWGGITVESAVTCPRCDASALRMLVDSSNALVLSCDACAWSQTSSGERWSGEGNLRPAPRSAGKIRG